MTRHTDHQASGQSDHPTATQAPFLGPPRPHEDTPELATDSVPQTQAERLHEFIRARRDHLGLPQEAIAARLNISSRAYRDWERGRVKAWKDEKLFALAGALQLSEYQVTRLFLLALGRPPALDTGRTLGVVAPGTDAADLLDDYAVMLDSLVLPSVVVDKRWDIQMANSAYRELFSAVRAHPTAMPTANLLRFGLFHPDAPTVLADHLYWQLAMLAQLASSLEQHSEDRGLQAIRRDVFRHAALRDAYLTDMPNWVLGAGSDLVHHERTVRELRHPDPRRGLLGCRVVDETSRSLRAVGLLRLTFVLVSRAIPSCP
ncbi:helix-turn-helix domain-containing protein [Streptomyces sp. NPDC001941]|uniref:helix-turn-helix domain-containing protein n=1 Tax=Streptomyces sp. NPDC001941 TaxID=3154659 RepID=UPI00332D0E87